jgi:hypothetical protein
MTFTLCADGPYKAMFKADVSNEEWLLIKALKPVRASWYSPFSHMLTVCRLQRLGIQ